MPTSLLRRGSVGRDVAELQAKLDRKQPTLLPRLSADGIFGPRTEARVREFQRSKGLKDDGIVGPLTRLALDREEPPPDPLDERNLMHCTDFPHPAPPLRASLLRSPNLLASLTLVAAPPPLSPRAQALTRKPEALKWVDKSIKALNDVLTLMRTGLRADADKLEKMEEARALNTHFKLNRASDPLKLVTRLLQNYNLIAISIRNADRLWVDDLTNLDDFANAFLGGFLEPQDPRRGRIRFCPAFLGKGIRFQTMVIIHEGAHFVSRDIGHFASELPFPDGTPVDSGKNYAQLLPDEAARNAYTYAQFALHIEMGRDHRIKPFNE